MPRRIVRRVVEYKCKVCGTTYAKKRDAQKCEKRVLEEKEFKKGDWVVILEKRWCRSCSPSRYCLFAGQIKKIKGPFPSDEEYELKWLGGQPKRVQGHIFEYWVKLWCRGGCNSTSGPAPFYAPEIELANKPDGRKSKKLRL